jgi:hypothetical protein
MGAKPREKGTPAVELGLLNPSVRKHRGHGKSSKDHATVAQAPAERQPPGAR